MSQADKYFKEEINRILAEGFNDEAYEVRPHWPDGTPAHTVKVHCAIKFSISHIPKTFIDTWR